MWQVRPPLTGLAFGTEFEYIAKETAKRRAAEMRESRKQRSEHQQGTTQQRHQDEQEIYDDDDDYGGGFDFGGDDDGDDRDYVVGTSDGLVNNAGVASLADAFSSVGVGGQGGETVVVGVLWRMGIFRTQPNPLDFSVAQNQNPTLDQKRLRSFVERILKLLPRVPKNMHSVLS
jgi:hypothetical protein